MCFLGGGKNSANLMDTRSAQIDISYNPLFFRLVPSFRPSPPLGVVQILSLSLSPIPPTFA